MTKMIGVFGLCLLGALLTGPRAEALDLGPLTGSVALENAEPWEIWEDRGWLAYENRERDTAIRYTFLRDGLEDAGSREVSVDVQITKGGEASHAGILYGFNEEDQSFHMFTLNGDNTVSLHYFKDGNVETPMKLSIEDPGRSPVRLTLREEGQKISLAVNGDENASWGSNTLGQGMVGIVVWGKGGYRLNGFRVTPDPTAVSDAAREPEAPAPDETENAPAPEPAPGGGGDGDGDGDGDSLFPAPARQQQGG